MYKYSTPTQYLPSHLPPSTLVAVSSAAESQVAEACRGQPEDHFHIWAVDLLPNQKCKHVSFSIFPIVYKKPSYLVIGHQGSQ